MIELAFHSFRSFVPAVLKVALLSALVVRENAAPGPGPP